MQTLLVRRLLGRTAQRLDRRPWCLDRPRGARRDLHVIAARRYRAHRLLAVAHFNMQLARGSDPLDRIELDRNVPGIFGLEEQFLAIRLDNRSRQTVAILQRNLVCHHRNREKNQEETCSNVNTHLTPPAVSTNQKITRGLAREPLHKGTESKNPPLAC